MRYTLFLLALVALAGCRTDPNQGFAPGERTPSADDDDDSTDILDDDDDSAEIVDINGRVIDRATGAGIEGVTVNDTATTGANGEFSVTPGSWDPSAALTVNSPNHVAWNAVLDQPTWETMEGSIEVGIWETAAGTAWYEGLGGADWDEGLGVLIVDFRTPTIEVAEGLGANIGDLYSVHVFDSAGNGGPGSTIGASPALPWVLFTGVPPGETTVKLTLHDGMVCNGPTTLTVLPATFNQLILNCVVE